VNHCNISTKQAVWQITGKIVKLCYQNGHKTNCSLTSTHHTVNI